MHELDLTKYQIRTDLIVDSFTTEKHCHNYHKKEIKKDIYLEEVNIDTEEEAKLFHKKKGIYKTITFKDITDSDNFKKVEDVFSDTFRDMLRENDIKPNASVLIIGLGNHKSTPDALGPKSLNHILVTRHLFNLGQVEDGYRCVSIFSPGVTGETGIETKDSILAMVEKVKPDFVIVIDALATSSIERLNKTIQISNAGITPGSGVNNSRISIEKETINLPVMVIGIPTIIDSAVIVSNTITYMLQKFSYDKNNFHNNKDKLKAKIDYTNYHKSLNKKEKELLLGIVGTLSEEELLKLVFEVLNPIDYNYMVTPKEIDFLIDKMTLLIGHGLNRSLHNAKRNYDNI